jgi:hypothetical protein
MHGIETPVRFHTHSFRAACGKTLGCKVLYNNRYQVNQPDDVVSLPIRDDIFKLVRDEVGIRNFPGPVVVTWRSSDGMPHEARIDMAKLFRGQVVRRTVKDEDLASRDIMVTLVLLVEDRMVRVYQLTNLLLNKRTDSGNVWSDGIEEVIPVYTNVF